MCGIVGYTHKSGRLSNNVLDAALQSLSHRGPDHQGRFVSDNISLGATRLRILDLECGDQPLMGRDGDVVVVFNGEVFNHPEIRAELEAENFSFKTRSDTEVVLNAFLRWDCDCFSRLRGMFAVAVWVVSERRLILARDRMGIKPLYYSLQKGDIYFGSELKCLFAHPAVSRKLCLEGLNCFLSVNYVPGRYTLIEGILKLEPGHYLEWRSDRCNLRSYVEPASFEPEAGTLDEAAHTLDRLLDSAVREHLVTDVPLGLWLSGGLDSSTVLYYAAKSSAKPLNTYSITFKGHSFDESRYIKEIGHYFGSNHCEFDLSTDAEITSVIEEMAYYSDEPSADAGALPLWFLAKMTKKTATVVLTGDGADELFAGYVTYKANRYSAVARKLPVAGRKAALWCAMRLPVSDEKIGFEYKLKRFWMGSLLAPEAAHVFWNGTFSETEKHGLFRYADSQPLTSLLNRMSNGSGLQRFLDFDQRYYLADDILYKVDRMSMAHSIEARPPFLDHRIVEFARRLPHHFKLRGTTSKYVLRHLMAEKLPASVLRRPKIGFDVPIHAWFRGVLRSFLLDTLSRDAVTSSKLFHWPTVQKLISAHLDRKENLGYHLWGLVVLLTWMRKWNIQPEEFQPTKQTEVVSTFDLVGSCSPQPALSSS